MEPEIIIIVDRGRGPQLSTSRITVQDLLPYFRLGYPHKQIIREAMPRSASEMRLARTHRKPKRSSAKGVSKYWRA
jgi:hypothetical protein